MTVGNCPLFLSVLLCFSSGFAVLASPEKVHVVDFENIFDEAEASLTDEIRGLRFDGVHVFTPAPVRNSASLPLSAATSGASAASTFGALIEFSKPVIAVSARFSPSFLAINGTFSARLLYIVGYDAQGRRVAEAFGGVLTSVPDRETAESFVPSLVELRSEVPLAAVTIDFSLDYDNSGPRFLFDDLTFTTIPRGHAR